MAMRCLDSSLLLYAFGFIIQVFIRVYLETLTEGSAKLCLIYPDKLLFTIMTLSIGTDRPL